jgi:hypothetical protein
MDTRVLKVLRHYGRLGSLAEKEYILALLKYMLLAHRNEKQEQPKYASK